MISALFTVLALLLIGSWLRRLGRVPDNAAETLNRIVIDVCVPATILRLVPSLSLEPSLAVLVLVPWSMVLVAYLLTRLAAGWLAMTPEQRVALFIATALGNTSFLGFPLVNALLGEHAIALAAVYDQLGSFLILSIVTPFALASVNAGARPRPPELLKRVLLFPPFLALVVALLPLPRPEIIESVLQLAAAALVPLAMIAVGLKLRLTPPRPRAVFALGLAIKLVLMPLLAWGMLRLVDVPPLIEKVAVLETAMPTMITGGAMLMAYGVASDLAAAFVGWGLVLSLATVPVWSMVLAG